MNNKETDMTVREILAAIDRKQARIEELEYHRWLLMQQEEPEEPSGDDILSVHEVADYLHCTRDKIYNMVHRKQIPCSRVGAHWLFSKREVFQASIRKHMQ